MAKKEPIDPQDVMPVEPKTAENDADRPRWIAEDMRYKEALSAYQDHQRSKLTHPEQHVPRQGSVLAVLKEKANG